MKGTTFKQKDRGRWAVSWYDEIYHKKCFTVTRYTPTWDFLWSEEMAEKQLRLMQHDWELHHQGKGQFRIEKYLGRGWTNVPEFYKEWMVEVVEQKRKPATIKGYWSYFFNWIEPFFIQDPIMLHEINLAILTKFMNYIKLEPKGKLNVMSAFHGMMDYAYRSEEIPKLPPFPKMEDYNIVEPIPEWIQRDLQMKIVGHIPEPDKWPIIWQILHYRRTGETCALHKVDYDPINDYFKIRRSISARQLVESTKTRKIHIMPCDPEFTPIARKLLNQNLESPYMFVNPRARKPGKRYTHESLNNAWRKACKKESVDIALYPGTKHTACTAFIEDGGNVDELMDLTGHQNRKSAYRYIDVTLKRKRDAMERAKARAKRKNYYKTTTRQI